MTYNSGDRVKLGDIVAIEGRWSGVVVAMIDEGAYDPAFPASEWDCLKRGALIRFDEAGLVHYEYEIEPDVGLIARAAPDRSGR